MDKKKFWIFPFVLCLLATLFTLGLNRSSAETSTVSVTGKFADTITSVNVTNNEGGDLTWELEQWATFRIQCILRFSWKKCQAGEHHRRDCARCPYHFSDSFEIRDINTNEVIAHATVDAAKKSISLTYTDYVEKHSDTNGSFFFYARIDFQKHPEKGEPN